MCIVVIKEMGKEFPSVENIQNCVDENPDGFALMYNEGGLVKTYRSMSDTAFIKKYKKLRMQLDKDTTSMVIHCRIATHGSTNIKNTHCWTAMGDKIGFAHNGVLTVKNCGDMTDSETFFRHIFVPIFKTTKSWKDAEYAIKAIIGTSKFAFLEGDGTVHHYGNYIKEKDGCLYSNSSYEGYSRFTRVFTTPKGYKGYTGYGCGYYNGASSRELQTAPVWGSTVKDERYFDDDDYYGDWRCDYPIKNESVAETKLTKNLWEDDDDLPVDDGFVD